MTAEIEKISTNRVISLGAVLILFGMLGFYLIPGMIMEEAGGSKLVNAFYCSVMSLTTIGFGDICPGDTDIVGKIFMTVLPLLGLGFFCGPILEIASRWQNAVPGGLVSVMSLTVFLGVAVLSSLEGFSLSEAVHLCVITGTTIGYGDITPKTDAGRFLWAIYAVCILNAMGGVLDMGKELLESFCKEGGSLPQRKKKE